LPAVLGYIRQAIPRRSEAEVAHYLGFCVSVGDEQVPVRQDRTGQVKLDAMAVGLANLESVLTVVGKKWVRHCNVLLRKIVIGQSPEKAPS
jgi:hypothetical protein